MNNELHDFYKWMNVSEALEYMKTGGCITTDIESEIPYFKRPFDNQVNERWPDNDVGELYTDEQFLTEFVDEEFRKAFEKS